MTDRDVPTMYDTAPDMVVEALLDAQAEADYDAGRVVPHAQVAAWLQS